VGQGKGYERKFCGRDKLSYVLLQASSAEVALATKAGRTKFNLLCKVANTFNAFSRKGIKNIWFF
jgi:hypothetical protein